MDRTGCTAITDYVFDTLMGEKEIITIDNIKYEKVQYMFSPTAEQRWIGMYPIFEQIPIKIKVEGDASTMFTRIIHYGKYIIAQTFLASGIMMDYNAYLFFKS